MGQTASNFTFYSLGPKFEYSYLKGHRGRLLLGTVTFKDLSLLSHHIYLGSHCFQDNSGSCLILKVSYSAFKLSQAFMKTCS